MNIALYILSFLKSASFPCQDVQRTYNMYINPACFQAGHESSMSRQRPCPRAPPSVFVWQRYGNFPNNKTIAPPNLTIRQGFIHPKHRQKNVILTGTAPFSCAFPLSGLPSPCVSQPVPPRRRNGCG